MINIFDDKIEFVSIGGLVNGLSKEGISQGISKTQNQNLANIFYSLKRVEAYGTGHQRIFDLYTDDNIEENDSMTKKFIYV